MAECSAVAAYGSPVLSQFQERIVKKTASEKMLGFRIHAIAFALGMAVVLVINLWIGPPYWVLWVLLGWGIGVLAHWWFVLGPGAGRPGPN